MGLLPLEFRDCLLDSPYFRENLRSHEKQLEESSARIKGLIGGIQDLLEAARKFSAAQRDLAHRLANFHIDWLGTAMTDDEVIISSSLKQFGQFLSDIEREMEFILKAGDENILLPFNNFRKEQIGSVKQHRKQFEKATQKLCSAQDKYISTSGKKEEILNELSDNIREEQKQVNSTSLEYIYNLQTVQEKTKHELVSVILDFTKSWVKYYHSGFNVTVNNQQYIAEVDTRLQKTRDNFGERERHLEELKNRLKSNSLEPSVKNKMYLRQGYLYLQEKKKLTTGWSKQFCQYEATPKRLTLIPYNQLVGKVGTGESIQVYNCTCNEEASDKFRFSVTGKDSNQAFITLTLQALSDQDRKNWVEALGGTWPAVSTLQRIRADSVEENLNSSAFTFLKDCLQELENRGLNDQGLYRVGGVISKVKRLLSQAIDPQPGQQAIQLSDPKQWESKTLASAIKQYLRELSKPVMTFQLYNNFISAVKHETDERRVEEMKLVVSQLPQANRKLLHILINHLSKVAANAEKNLMTASNLGVCFGPTLLRPVEETVASIMDIKFSNEVIEILIENADVFFPPEVPGSDDGTLSSLAAEEKDSITAAKSECDDDDCCLYGGGQHQTLGGSGLLVPGSSTASNNNTSSSCSQLSTSSCYSQLVGSESSSPDLGASAAAARRNTSAAMPATAITAAVMSPRLSLPHASQHSNLTDTDDIVDGKIETGDRGRRHLLLKNSSTPAIICSLSTSSGHNDQPLDGLGNAVMKRRGSALTDGEEIEVVADGSKAGWLNTIDTANNGRGIGGRSQQAGGPVRISPADLFGGLNNGMSVNSLPDMSNLSETRSQPDGAGEKQTEQALRVGEGGDRPRSKSHQHEMPLRVPGVAGNSKTSDRFGVNLNLALYGGSVGGHQGLDRLTDTKDQKSLSQEVQLDSSLEMMNSLVADLDMRACPLKRSSTLQPSRIKRGPNNIPQKEITKKPPLPAKLLASPTTSPPALAGNSFLPFVSGSGSTATGTSLQASSPSSSDVTTSSSSTGGGTRTSAGDPTSSRPDGANGPLGLKLQRPGDLPGKLVLDSLGLSPALTRRHILHPPQTNLQIEESLGTYGFTGSSATPLSPTKRKPECNQAVPGGDLMESDATSPVWHLDVGRNEQRARTLSPEVVRKVSPFYFGAAANNERGAGYSMKKPANRATTQRSNSSGGILATAAVSSASFYGDGGQARLSTTPPLVTSMGYHTLPVSLTRLRSTSTSSTSSSSGGQQGGTHSGGLLSSKSASPLSSVSSLGAGSSTVHSGTAVTASSTQSHAGGPISGSRSACGSDNNLLSPSSPSSVSGDDSQSVQSFILSEKSDESCSRYDNLPHDKDSVQTPCPGSPLPPDRRSSVSASAVRVHRGSGTFLDLGDEFNNNSARTHNRNSLTGEPRSDSDGENLSQLIEQKSQKLLRMSGAKEQQTPSQTDAAPKTARRASEDAAADEHDEPSNDRCRDSQVLEDFALKMMQTVDIHSTSSSKAKTNDEQVKQAKRLPTSARDRSSSTSEKPAIKQVVGTTGQPVASVDVRSKVMNFGEPVSRLRNGSVVTAGNRKISYRDSGPYENVPDYERRMMVVAEDTDGKEPANAADEKISRQIKPVEDDDLGSNNTGLKSLQKIFSSLQTSNV